MDAQWRRHAANTEALLDRQDVVLPVVVELARREAIGDVRVGFPPRIATTGVEPVRRYAMGIPVWVGTPGSEVLWAVVCPVASRIGPAVRGYIGAARVFAADDHEAKRIGFALGRPVHVAPL